jgi:hypothetical protein
MSEARLDKGWAAKGGGTDWSARSFEWSLLCPDLAHPQRDL